MENYAAKTTQDLAIIKWIKIKQKKSETSPNFSSESQD